MSDYSLKQVRDALDAWNPAWRHTRLLVQARFMGDMHKALEAASVPPHPPTLTEAERLVCEAIREDLSNPGPDNRPTSDVERLLAIVERLTGDEL